MPKYSWIIFDADGTLFDYDRSARAALAGTLKQYGVGFDAAIHRRFTDINNRLWREFELGRISSEKLRVQRFEKLATVSGIQFNPSEFSADYIRNLGAQGHLLPGSQEVVRGLAQKADLALATNGIAETQHSRFAASSIRPFFKALVISDEVGAAKPAAKFFRELFSRIGNPGRSQVLMVGDSLSSDIKGGSDFGIDTCWFNPPGRTNDTPIQPTYEIREIYQINEIV